MAQGDLYRLLRQISEEVHKNTTVLRDEMEAWTHYLDVSADDVTKQVFIQLRDIELKQRGQQGITRTYGYTVKNEMSREDATSALSEIGEGTSFSEDAKTAIKAACNAYAENVYNLLQSAKGSSFQVDKVKGNNTNYTLKITPLGTANANVYKFLTKGKVLEIAKTRLKRELNLLYSKYLKKVLPKRQIDVRKEVFFHLGHITAVSEVQASKAITSLQSAIKDVETKWNVAGLAESLINYEMLSKFSSLGNPEFTKDFDSKVAYVRPESEASNLTQSGYEKEVLNRVRAAFKKIIDANPSWAEQGGSDSVVDAIGKSLMQTAAKRGAKVQGNIKINSKSNKSTIQDKIKSKERKITQKIGSIGAEDYKQVQTSTPTVNLKSLIPVLNMRLPEFVRANMGQGGRLVNRTGRFAESSKIIDISEDATISYTYMRYPYGVFEQDRARDPRPLIEQSIRELARGLIQEKFNTRRV
jgi:hypothetical protein